jgi:GT2 family glycosyltransferase/SAM-dependent methyltransferase
MASPKVVAIVLNWNRVDDTCQCVASLRKSDYDHLELLVVDNGSSAAAYAQLRSRLGDTDILRSETNLGFAGGNNLGLRAALERGADYALVINNDTVVDPAMVRQLVEAGQARPEVALLGPIIYYMSQPEVVWFAGYRFSRGIYLLRRGLHLEPPVKPIEDVDFVSGCGMLLRRSALEQGLLFSDQYFMYYEDLDLCFRAKEAGMGVACVTGARMWHAVSASTGGADSPLKQYYQVKSSLIFYRQHSRGLKLWLNIGLRLAHAAQTLLLAVLSGRLKLGAIPMFLRGLREGWGAAAASPAALPATTVVKCCPVCGSQASRLLFAGWDHSFGLPGRFPVRRCAVCGTAYLAERPVDLAPYYPADRYSGFQGAAAKAPSAPGRRIGLGRRGRLLQSLKPAGGALLDVGCGGGDFLAAMQAIPGWQLAGLEPSPPAAVYAREVRKLDVLRGELPQPALDDRSFDVITLWHVLEHVPDPAAALREVRRLLRPEGLLILAVPVADSWEARAFGANWAGYDVPRHMLTFTRASLERLLTQAGYEPTECPNVIVGLASLRLSLGWWLEQQRWLAGWLQSAVALALLPGAFVLMWLADHGRASVAVYSARPVCAKS